jgi:uncharacterized glyoxalase superfamily protein PhnB
MTNTNPVHRYPTITPHLGVENPAAALDFYKRAFEAQELVRLALPDGTIGHRWIVATHLEDVPYDEQQRRLTEMMGQATSG